MHRSIALALLAASCAAPPAADPAPAVSTGAWHVMTAVVSIRQDGADWIVRHQFPGGEVAERRATRFADDFRIAGSAHGDFYRLRSDGQLEAHDDEGLIQVAAPVR